MGHEPKYDNEYATKGYVDGLVTGVSEYVEIGYNKNFGAQPVPPYRVNDTWVDGSDIWVCTTQRLIGNFNISDWTKAVAYVKPQEMEDYVNSEIEDYSEYIDGVLSGIQNQIDGVVDVWFYEGVPTLSNEPAVNWTTNELKADHVGDTYVNMLTGDSYRFAYYDSIYSWIQQIDSTSGQALELAQQAKDLADNKRRIFTTTPFTPYDVGDLWVETLGNPNSNIKRCITAKATGTLNTAHWELVEMSHNVKTAIDGGLVTTGTLQLQDGAGVTKAGITANGTGDNSIRIWAGGTYDNRASSSTPFRVTQGGKVTASDLHITGGTMQVGSGFSVNSSGTLTATGANISGAITATSGSFTGTLNSTSGSIGGWTLGSMSFYSGNPSSGNNGAQLIRDGRMYMKNDYGWLNTGPGGTIVSGNATQHPVIISDHFKYTPTSGYAIELSALYGGIRQAVGSAYTIRLERNGGGFIEIGNNVNLQGGHIQMENVTLVGTTFTGNGGAYHYSNSNCLLAPASGFAAYVTSTSAGNKILTASSGLSSRNVKENIVSMEDQYNDLYTDLQKLNTYTFDYKYSGIKDYKSDFGFIIDEIEELPTISKYTRHYENEGFLDGKKLIQPRENNDEFSHLDKIKYKEWDRDSYIKLLLLLNKSLQVKVDSLESRLEKLEALEKDKNVEEK